MTEPERPVSKPLSAMLSEVGHTLRGEDISVRELLAQIGEQGMLVFAIFLIVPFLVPVSIPGVSTVFGLLITLIGLGVMANRMPWLPAKLMDRRVPAKHLSRAFEQGAKLVARLERFLHPRLAGLSSGAAMKRFNGLMLVVAGVLLMFPLGLVPFSNTLPGLAILFLAVGMLQKDGVFVLLGYLLILATIVYFAALFAGALAAGQGLRKLLSG